MYRCDTLSRDYNLVRVKYWIIFVSECFSQAVAFWFSSFRKNMLKTVDELRRRNVVEERTRKHMLLRIACNLYAAFQLTGTGGLLSMGSTTIDWSEIDRRRAHPWVSVRPNTLWGKLAWISNHEDGYTRKERYFRVFFKEYEENGQQCLQQHWASARSSHAFEDDGGATHSAGELMQLIGVAFAIENRAPVAVLGEACSSLVEIRSRDDEARAKNVRRKTCEIPAGGSMSPCGQIILQFVCSNRAFVAVLCYLGNLLRLVWNEKAPLSFSAPSSEDVGLDFKARELPKPKFFMRTRDTCSLDLLFAWPFVVVPSINGCCSVCWSCIGHCHCLGPGLTVVAAACLLVNARILLKVASVGFCCGVPSFFSFLMTT